jgi:crotonobetainyl-CoA:carnitine CoA-transferase CaiB-like acyl-CoA transferase
MCSDGKYVVIGANGDSLFQRLMRAIGRPDMADDPRFANNAGRVRHEPEIDAVIAQWARANASKVVIAVLEEIPVPGGPIYSVADMAQDPHFQARGLFEQVAVDGQPLKIPAILPKLADTPGRTDWPGPALGAHTREVLSALLGLSSGELDRLAARR